MLKTKFKLLIYLLITFLLFSSASFATNNTAEGDPEVVSAPISNETATDGETTEDPEAEVPAEETDITNSDLYERTVKDFSFNERLDGNAFISARDFTLDSNESRGMINGDLYLTALNERFTSEPIYSATEKDDEGNAVIEDFQEYASVTGDVYIMANKVVIDPGCVIEGNLTIIANEVEIGQYASIYGNLYVSANKMTFNGLVGKDVYATLDTFNMSYYAYILRDIHLTVDDALINGRIRRNTFINADELYTNKDFMGYGNMEVDSRIFALIGEVSGDLKVKAKDFYVITSENIEEHRKVLESAKAFPNAFSNLLNPTTTLSFATKINGNTDYTSGKELDLKDIALGEVSYHKYSPVAQVLKTVAVYLINLCAFLLYVLVIYIVIKKFAPTCLQKVTKLNIKSSLISLGIGIALVIVVPLLFMLLSLIEIGVFLGLLILVLYLLFILVSTPTVLIMISENIKVLVKKWLGDKLAKSIEYICLVLTVLVFTLLLLIPYVNAILIVLTILLGTGNLLTSHFKKE